MHLTADTFLDCLLLLLADNSERNRNYVKNIFQIKADEDRKREMRSSDSDLADFYARLTREVMDNKVSQQDAASMQLLLLKIKSDPIRSKEPAIIDILTDILNGDTPLTADDITKHLNRIRNVLIMNGMNKGLRIARAKFNNIANEGSPEHQVAALDEISDLMANTVREFELAKSEDNEVKGENYINLSDKESIARAINTYVERSVTGIIRTGLQGLNRSLGKRGGIGLGETIVFAARSHNYKTGMLVSLMVWCVIYNTHIKPPDGKRFLVYFVSLENETYQNLIDVFRMLYSRIHQKSPDDMDHDAIVDWLHEFFAKFNIDLVIDRKEPHDFTFKRYVQQLTHFEERGYVLLSFILDYMSEARGVDSGDTVSSQGRLQLIGENYIKFCGIAKTRGYMMATGHQLTKDADRIAQDGGRNAVKKFNPSMFSFSPDVFRIVDIVHYLNIELNIDGFSFLTVQNRKNRNCKDTPEKDKFFGQPFTPFGIMDDLNGEPQYVVDIDAWGVNNGSREDEINQAALF